MRKIHVRQWTLHLHLQFCPNTQQSPVDLWLFLLRWPHTPQAFLETLRQAGYFCWREHTHNTRNLIPWCEQSIQTITPL